MPVTDALFGRALATSEERAEQVGPSAGIGIFGLDAISSAAYGPEAALTLLIPLGLLGVHYIVPVIAAILILLAILYFSYRQTIDAYPHGGGSYTVTPGRYQEKLVLNLPPGDYQAEWIDPATYSTLATHKFKQTGALHVIDTPTYTVDIALRISRD